MQEVQTTDDDNIELRIADYYKHFPAAISVDDDDDDANGAENTDANGKKVWL